MLDEQCFYRRPVFTVGGRERRLSSTKQNRLEPIDDVSFVHAMATAAVVVECRADELETVQPLALAR